MTLYNSVSADRFRRTQVGNPRKEYGYDHVTVDVSLYDEGGAQLLEFHCFVVLDPDDKLRSSVMGGCTSRHAPTSAERSQMRANVDRFIAKHDALLRALGPRVCSGPL